MQSYVFTLADLAADTLNQAYARAPESIQAVVDYIPASGCACGGPGLSDMRSAIEFEGTLNGEEKAAGILFGGLANDNTLRALAKSCGLAETLARQSADELVAEFLNIIIGLAEGQWAEKNLEIRFSPPTEAAGLNGRVSGQIFRIVLTDGPDECLALCLYFSQPADL